MLLFQSGVAGGLLDTQGVALGCYEAILQVQNDSSEKFFCSFTF
jgi:hypothetical protein